MKHEDKTATGDPVHDEGSRQLPMVLAEELRRRLNTRFALVHKALKCVEGDSESYWMPKLVEVVTARSAGSHSAS